MDQLTRIEAKLDLIARDVGEIKVMDAVQNEQLAHHIKRTDLLEKKVDNLWQKALVAVSLLGGVLTLIKTMLQ